MITGDRYFTSLDACLGPGDERFFGSGYKRVGQNLADVTAGGPAVPGALVVARAGLSYPLDWSRKSTASRLRPHLSSIDALVLAAQLAEIQLNHSRSLTAEQQRHTWLPAAEIRAGSRPHEDLAGFPVRARLSEITEAPGPTGATRDERATAEFATAAEAGRGTTLRSTYDCRIGSLKVRCVLEHAAGAGDRAGRPAAVYATGDEALGPARTRHYGDGYKTRRLFSEGVAVDLAGQRVRAGQHIVPEPGDSTATRGAEAAYAPSVSLVDCMVGIAQLAQVLLYSQDEMSRGASNTLWMRRIVIEADSPVRPLDRPIDAVAYTTKTRTLRMGAGVWRCSDLAVDDFRGIHGSCSIAHQLPMARAA
ncbi:hypothetical protein LRS74_24805 [Streptomyces sp. LX-29]|uniref:AvrD family protein n=1 Tax=Streptomyces sp. LX-29 TaxID=2900152 RepID=UPI00240DAF13|nr:AvrD family protein [Streptomyces sp. LX-29]WFB09901.1 hypothetical protein LRS74_24805 [Streptomyces sp. LX-29]